MKAYNKAIANPTASFNTLHFTTAQKVTSFKIPSCNFFFVFLLLKDVSQKDDLMALFRVWDNFWQLKAL